MKKFTLQFFVFTTLLLISCKAAPPDDTVDPNAIYNPSDITFEAYCDRAFFEPCQKITSVTQRMRVTLHTNDCALSAPDSELVATAYAALSCDNNGCRAGALTPWISAVGGATLKELETGTYCARALYDLDGSNNSSVQDVSCRNQFVIRNESTAVNLSFSNSGVCQTLL